MSYLPALLWAALLLLIGGHSDVPTVDTDLPLDKAAHFVVYGVLGLLLAFAWRRSNRPRRPVWVLLAGVSIAAIDELHQRSVPGRSADPLDWLVDALGIALAVVLVMRYTRKSANVIRDSV